MLFSVNVIERESLMDPAQKNRTISALKKDFSEYSPRKKQVAKYILDNQADFGLDSIRETARKSGVSTYTLVRMSQTLGYESYEALREPFRHALVSGSEFVDQPEWLEELGGRGDIGRVQSEAARNSLAIVQRSLERQSPEVMEQVVDAMLAAENVYVTAVRASYAMAYYFHYVGRMALTSLQLIPRHMNSAIDELNHAQKGDVIIAITITPYSRETVEACKFAQEKGVKLVLITDSDIVTPEIRPDFVLVVSSISTHHFGCYSGMVSVLEGLLSLLMYRGGADAENRINSYEQLRGAHNAYWVVQKKH